MGRSLVGRASPFACRGCECVSTDPSSGCVWFFWVRNAGNADLFRWTGEICCIVFQQKTKKIENSIGLVLSKPSEVYWHIIDGLSDGLRSKGHHIHELD